MRLRRVWSGVYRLSMIRLWAEFAGLYVLLPASLLALRLSGWAVPVLPVLWAAALPAAVYLVRCEGWRARTFFDLSLTKRQVLRLGLRVVAAAVLLAAGMLLLDASRLMELPRRSVRLWGLVMACYPLLSVLPQGILYRGLFHARYAPLFGGGRGRDAAAALVFCLAHLLFGNVWALVLTLAGGFVLNRTYRRTGSLMASALEHAAYGQLVFTLGWGHFLYHGTARFLENLGA